jgi:hypothetical protein
MLRQREQEAAWQQELKKFEQERAAAFNLQQSQQDHEIRRMETINRLSDLAIAAVAAPSNVEAVAQIMNADSGRHVGGADPGAGAGGGGGTRVAAGSKAG